MGRDPGLQPFQRFLDQVDRDLEAGQLGGHRPQPLSRLRATRQQAGPEPPSQGRDQRCQAKDGGGRDGRGPVGVASGTEQRHPDRWLGDGQDVGHHVADDRSGHGHAGEWQSMGYPTPAHDRSIGDRPWQVTTADMARLVAVVYGLVGLLVPSVVAGDNARGR